MGGESLAYVPKMWVDSFPVAFWIPRLPAFWKTPRNEISGQLQHNCETLWYAFIVRLHSWISKLQLKENKERNKTENKQKTPKQTNEQKNKQTKKEKQKTKTNKNKTKLWKQ